MCAISGNVLLQFCDALSCLPLGDFHHPFLYGEWGSCHCCFNLSQTARMLTVVSVDTTERQSEPPENNTQQPTSYSFRCLSFPSSSDSYLQGMEEMDLGRRKGVGFAPCLPSFSWSWLNCLPPPTKTSNPLGEKVWKQGLAWVNMHQMFGDGGWRWHEQIKQSWSLVRPWYFSSWTNAYVCKPKKKSADGLAAPQRVAAYSLKNPDLSFYWVTHCFLKCFT